MTTCSNCQTDIAENYCPNCGQKYVNSRIRFGHLLKEFLSTFFSFDKSFFSNVGLMFMNPSSVVLNYWNGFRNFHYSPNRFLVISILFLGVNFIITGNQFIGLNVSTTHDFFTLPLALYLFLIPMSTLSTFLIYLRYRKNFFEHLVLNVYSFSYWTILFSLVSVSFELLGLFETWLIKVGTQLLYLLIIMYWNSSVFQIRTLVRIPIVLANLLLFVAAMFALFYFAGS